MPRKSTLAALALLSLVPLAPAQAGSPAFAGRARSAADASCFTYDVLGDIFNSCGSARDFIIPFHVGSSGGYNVTVHAQSSSASSNVCCRAYAMSATTASMTTSPQRCLDSFQTGVYRQISLAAVTVYSYGSLFVQCSVGNGARIRVASF